MKRILFAAITYFLAIFGYRISSRDGKHYFEKNVFFDEFKVYRKFFNIDDNLTIFDVGGHLGQSVNDYLKNFKKCTVHSFEPIGDNFKLLSRRFENNSQVVLNQLAVSSDCNDIEINVFGSNSSGNSFYKPTNSIPYEISKVKSTTLDEYFKKRELAKINILKIDTQGYERECLEGTRLLLSKSLVDLIKVEIMFHRTYDRETSFRLIEEVLHEYNYSLYDICMIKKSSRNCSTLIVDAIYVSKQFLQTTGGQV